MPENGGKSGWQVPRNIPRLMSRKLCRVIDMLDKCYYACILIPPDTWAIFKLPLAYPKSTSANVGMHTSMLGAESTDVMSGVEIEAPHKQLSMSREFPCTIAEIGKVSSSWISQRGLHDIIELRAEEQTGDELKTKSSELRVLAVECLRALESAGLGASDDPQVKKATELCLLYAPKASPAVQKTQKHISCEIAGLWR